MKRLLRITVFTLALLASATAVLGQTVVQNVPQSVNMRVLNAVTSAQCGNITQNIGQNVHLVTYSVVSTGTFSLRLRLEASNDGTTFFPISNEEAARITASTDTGAVFGFGYFPVLRACIVETDIAGAPGSSITVNYTGTSSTQKPEGGFNSSQGFYRPLALAAAGATTVLYNTFPPFGSSVGVLIFQSTGALPAATCTLRVTSFSGFSAGVDALPATPLAAATTVQVFFVRALPSTKLQVQFASCGATGVTYNLNYYYYSPIFPLASMGVAGDGVAVAEAAFVCPLSAVITIAGAGTIKPIAEVAGQTIRICHISIAFAAATNAQLVTGTGATCGTGTANLTGNYQAVTSMALDFDRGGLRTPVGVGLCITTSAAVAGGGVVTFARF